MTREPVRTRDDVEAIRRAAFRVRYLEMQRDIAIRKREKETAILLREEIAQIKKWVREKYNLIL